MKMDGNRDSMDNNIASNCLRKSRVGRLLGLLMLID